LLEAAHFLAIQNARLVASAIPGDVQWWPDSWSLCDSHMDETLEALSDYLDQPRLPPKVVVWAHNPHVGDARHTEMGWHGQSALGQLDAPGDSTAADGNATAVWVSEEDGEGRSSTTATFGEPVEISTRPKTFAPLIEFGDGESADTHRRAINRKKQVLTTRFCHSPSISLSARRASG
jgi:hypothetical protein